MTQNPVSGQVVICRSARQQHSNSVEYQIEIAGKTYLPYFDSPHAVLNGSIEAAVCMSSLGAMRHGLDLLITEPVSQTFLANQQRLMSIFTSWFPEYRLPHLQAESLRQAEPLNSGRVGSFFTGGVDSFYTFLKHRSEITDLIYVHGYDVRLEDMEKRQAISAMGAAIERDTGVRFIEIETNAVRLFKDHGRWGLHGHGYGLGTIVRLLDGYLDKIYIPSSFAEAELMPWASHPDTDVLFADEAIGVIHDGCEVGRTEKIKLISTNAMALQHLRVCWEKTEGTYNCGVCEKCLRTMTTLYGLGQLSATSTFPNELSAQAIRSLLIESQSAQTFALENVRFLDNMGLKNDLVREAWMYVAIRPNWKNMLLRRSRRIKKQFLRQWNKIKNPRPNSKES